MGDTCLHGDRHERNGYEVGPESQKWGGRLEEWKVAMLT